MSEAFFVSYANKSNRLSKCTNKIFLKGLFIQIITTFAKKLKKYYLSAMDWIQNLLFNDASVAHTVILYAFVIALGVALGKMKFFGISLGVTFVLFVGLIAGHFGFSAEKIYSISYRSSG